MQTDMQGDFMQDDPVTARVRGKAMSEQELLERFRRGLGFTSYEQALRWLETIPDSYVTGPEREGDDDDWITVGCPNGSRAVAFDVDRRGDDVELARRAAVVDGCNQLYRFLNALDDD
jgi:hypothetical protein